MAKAILVVYSSNCKYGSILGNETFEVKKYPLTALELNFMIEHTKDKYNFETVAILNIIPLRN